MTGPVPPYTNPVPNPQYYKPSVFDISSITRSGEQAIIVTSLPNNYVVGQLVRFLIPKYWGMWQLEGLSAYITAINSNVSFTANINISTFDSFTTPSISPIYQVAQVNAIGDQNITSAPVNNNVLSISGAFVNISPS